MAKERQIPILGSKEMLMAFCSTLPERHCKAAYSMLKERFGGTKTKLLFFNENGIEDRVNGQIRLTQTQHDKVLKQLGEEAFKAGCKILNDYINHIKEAKAYTPKYVQAYKEYTTMSHLRLFTYGWVKERLVKMYPNGLPVRGTFKAKVDFFDIDSLAKAKAFVLGLPSELREDSPEVEYLYTQYPSLREEVMNEIEN